VQNFLRNFRASFIIYIGFHNVIYAEIIQEAILPLKFNTGNEVHGLPSCIIEIQGKNIPLILDTGASKYELALSRYALKNIKAVYHSKKECSKTISAKFCAETFIIPELKIGPFFLYNVQGIIMPKLWGGNDANFKHTEASKNGVIGLRLLSHYGLLLDYANSRAILTKANIPPQNYDITAWIKIPFNFQGGISTTAKINGEVKKLIWDTGANPSIIRSTDLINKASRPCPRDAYYNESGCSLIKTQQFSINNEIIPNNWFMLSSLSKSMPFDGFVGSNYYEKNVLFFDFNNKFIYIQKSE
jgi:predicted aspartyl protease